MSQVLEKPILLDETGQDIASKINGISGKLDSNSTAIIEQLDDNSDALVDALGDIKDALATSSEFIPIMIAVTSPPTKTSYMSGDALDLTGMAVYLIASNGATANITNACTFSPANGAALTSANTSIAVSYYYPKDSYTFQTTQNITVVKADRIRVDTPPTKAEYNAGDTLDLTGIVVEAVSDDLATYIDVTSRCIFNPANGATLAEGDDTITISYAQEGETLTTTQVIGVGHLISIDVTTPPTKTTYQPNETLDLTGIVVKATRTYGAAEDVTALCTFTPADGAVLDASATGVDISYTEGTRTKTTRQAITVKKLVSISVDTPPTKTQYQTGETLDLTGMTIKAHYSNGTVQDVTSGCTFSPANGATITSAMDEVTVTYTEGGITKTTAQEIVIIHIYGISRTRNNSDSAWTRTDEAVGLSFSASVGNTAGNSDFDNCYPWSEMERVVDGEDTFVKIPKFWYKVGVEGSTATMQIANAPVSGFKMHPAFLRGETQYDYILVGAYENSADYKSKSGQEILNVTAIGLAAARTAIHNRGNAFYLWDAATFSAIKMLVLVEIANYNTQSLIGAGAVSNSAPIYTGDCDTVPNLTGVPTGQANKVGVVWRGIENLWGNTRTFIDGVFFNGASSGDKTYHVCTNPDDFADTSKYTDAYWWASKRAGYYKELLLYETNYDWLLPPEGWSDNLPTSTTYVTDYTDNPSNNNSPLLVGGRYNDGQMAGLFSLNFSTAGYETTRLMKFPTT